MGSDGTPGDVIVPWLKFLIFYVGGAVVAFLVLVVIVTAAARLVRAATERRAPRNDEGQCVDIEAMERE